MAGDEPGAKGHPSASSLRGQSLHTTGRAQGWQQPEPQTWQVMNQIQDSSRELRQEPKQPGTKTEAATGTPTAQLKPGLRTTG